MLQRITKDMQKLGFIVSNHGTFISILNIDDEWNDISIDGETIVIHSDDLSYDNSYLPISQYTPKKLLNIIQ